MAMAPSLRVGGRIVSSVLGSSRDSSRRATGLRISACRGQFTVSAHRNAKGSSAAAWEEAADIYFGTSKEPDPNPTPQGDQPEQKIIVEDHKSRPYSRTIERTRSIVSPRNPRRWSRGEDLNPDSPRGRGRFGRSSEQEEAEDETDGWGVAVRYSSQSNVNTNEDDDDDNEGLIDEPRPVEFRRPRQQRSYNNGYRNDALKYYDPREHERPSEVPRLQGEAVYGVGPIRAALQSRRRDLYVLYVQQGLDEEHANRRRRKEPADVVWILNNAKRLGLRIETVSKHVLNMMVENRPHQGFVLDASALEMVDIAALEDPGKVHVKAPVWVALDEVKDPQNFGAILRTCHFFGVSGVVVCTKNSAPLSGVVSKASAGALELIDLLSCKNMMMFLRDSADNGWRILGTSNTSESVVLGDLPKNVPTVLVLGNEGVGIRPFVKAACDFMVRIPGALPLRRPRTEEVMRRSEDGGEDGEAEVDDEQLEADPDLKFKSVVRNELIKLNAEVDCFLRPGTVDSLNVSVAAGVLLNGLINFNPDEQVKSLPP